MFLQDDPKPSAAAAARRPAAIVPIREIGPRHRERVRQHLLALDTPDRQLRFGHAASDGQIHAYVDGLDFQRDHLLGIFNSHLALVAFAHLAFAPPAADGGAPGFAEFGVSVAGHARRRGYGRRLFERAAICAANSGVKTLYIHALSENAAMLRIARQAGAAVRRNGGESEAHLHLPEASFKTRMSELLAGQVGHVDYLLKSEVALMRGLLATAQEVRQAVREGRHKSAA